MILSASWPFLAVTHSLATSTLHTCSKIIWRASMLYYSSSTMRIFDCNSGEISALISVFMISTDLFEINLSISSSKEDLFLSRVILSLISSWNDSKWTVDSYSSSYFLSSSNDWYRTVDSTLSPYFLISSNCDYNRTIGWFCSSTSSDQLFYEKPLLTCESFLKYTSF